MPQMRTSTVFVPDNNSFPVFRISQKREDLNMIGNGFKSTIKAITSHVSGQVVGAIGWLSPTSVKDNQKAQIRVARKKAGSFILYSHE